MLLPDARPARRPPASARPDPSRDAGRRGHPVLDVRGCTAGYGAAPVVHDVDLRVAAGECVALLGGNGSGKTTLLRAVLGLADVLAGRIDVRAATVGYVPQRHTVAPTVPATVGEVVASGYLPLTGPLRRLRPARRRLERDAVDRALAAVGLEESARRPVAELSGGQQRRVLLARALTTDPDLLLLDEPTAGVDEASRRLVDAALASARTAGAAVVVVTHELAALRGAVTRTVALSAGRVVAEED